MLASVIYLQMLGIRVSFQYVLSLTYIVTLVTFKGWKFSRMNYFYVPFHIIRPCKLFRTNITLVSLDSQVYRFFMNFQVTIPRGLVITQITTKSYSFMHRHSMFSQSARIFCLIFAQVTVIYFHCTMKASSVLIELLCVVRFKTAYITLRVVVRVFGVNSSFMTFKIFLSFEFILAKFTREAYVSWRHHWDQWTILQFIET